MRCCPDCLCLCIFAVIFDHEPSAEWGHVRQTHWAWRSVTPSRLRLNYSTFAVVYDSPTLIANPHVNILDELVAMPTEDPERFRALRLGVSRAAARMRYALQDCSADTPLCDAFAMLKEMVVARGQRLNSGGKHKRAMT